MHAANIQFMACETMLATVLTGEEGAWIRLHPPGVPDWQSPLTLHFKGPGAFERAVRIATAINEATAPALNLAAE